MYLIIVNTDSVDNIDIASYWNRDGILIHLRTSYVTLEGSESDEARRYSNYVVRAFAADSVTSMVNNR